MNTRHAGEMSARPAVESCLLAQETRTTILNFEFNRLKNIQDSEDAVHTAQVIKDGRLGTFTAQGAADTEELLRKAKELSEFGPAAEYHFPEPEAPGNPDIYDPRVADLSIENMLRVGDELIDFARSLHPGINGRVMVLKTRSKRHIENSRGLQSEWEKTQFAVVLSAELVEGQNLVQVGDYFVSTHIDCDLEELKNSVKTDFQLARENVALEPGSYPVIFAPGSFMDLIAPILACLDGKAVVRQVSPLRGQLGEQVFSSDFSLIEDGNLDRAPGSNLYDEQGTRCTRTTLVGNGILMEYLLDLDTAARLGRRPTGTGRVSRIAHNNVIVSPGSVPCPDMVRSIKRGLIIKETMGAWAGNPYSGQVTGNIALGFLIENGAPVGRVKDCMFSVNVFKHLKENLVALSKEQKLLMNNALLPYALVDAVSIATRT